MPTSQPPSCFLARSQVHTKRLPAGFFEASAPSVARGLVGCILMHQLPGGARIGRIVETEAYDASDPASHSFRGPTARTQAMFGPGGCAYVYRSYGIHWCLNVSCGAQGFGAAVLIRALEPLAGLDAMAVHRGLDVSQKAHRRRLCQGPGNVTQAFGIDIGHNGQSVTEPPLFLCSGTQLGPDERIEAGPRIGISVARQTPWRFYIAGCPFVSGRRGRKISANRPA